MQIRNLCYLTLMAGAFAPTFITSGASAQLGGGDECASAVVIAADTATNFDTTNATASADIPTDALCSGTYLNWVATCKDVWFTFTATGPGTADFTTCNNATYDTSLALYKGDCATLVACNGDDGACTGYTSAILAYPCDAGDVFYLRIGGYGGGTTPDGDFGSGSVIVAFTASSAGCVGATGACNVVHAGLGCDNAVCCTAVCTFNPLCCEVGWDQGCVDLAIEQCGYYSCPVVAGAPVNNCATSPTTIPSVSSSRTFTTVGATTDGPITDGGLCNSGSDNFYGDIWYKVTPVANGSMTISTCDTVSFDNKLAVYNLGTNPATFDYNLLSTVLVGCNDDGASGVCMTTEATPTNYASEMSAAVSLGNTYLVRMGSFADVDRGTGTIRFTMPVPCTLPSFTTAEVEACGAATNNGCVSTVDQYQSINVAVGTPTTIGGTFFASGGTRDVDAYVFTIPTGMTVTAETFSASNVVMTIYNGLPCATQFIARGVGSCPRTLSYCLPAGTYSILVAPEAFDLNPCNNGVFNNYVLKLTAVASVCPSFGDTCGYTVASEVTQNTSQTIAAYSRGCLLFCGTSESTFSTEVKIARSFPGLTSGALGCVTLGVSNVDYAADGIAYAGAPFTAKIGLYRDTDGGDPVGADLVLISEQSFSVLGGNRLLTWNLDAPFSLTGNTNPIVVVLSGLIGGGCDPLTNNVFGGVGGAGSTAPWYVQSITPTTGLCADGTEFVAKVDQTNQWIVNLGMVSTTPPCPGDFNNDGFRNGADLASMLSAWGTAGGDVNGDNTTNGADLTVLLSGWGTCPN